MKSPALPRLVAHALSLVREYPGGLDGCEVGNSTIGSVMSITLRTPRHIAEAACREAKFFLEEQEQ